MFDLGFTHEENSEIYLFTPAQGSKLGIHTFKQKYIRPLHSLNPELENSTTKYGAVMSCQIFSEDRVIAGYENSQIILWHWRRNEILSTFPVPECGTVMSLCTSKLQSLSNIVVVAGSENKIVVLKVTKSEFEIIKVHEITNSGVGNLHIRTDKPILTSGGWDNRLRLFALINSEEKPFKLKPLAVLDFHSEAVECLTSGLLATGVYSGKVCTAAGSKDGKVSIWTLYT